MNQLPKNTLIYDIEIKRLIPSKEGLIKGIEYCKGWGDYENMGIAVFGAWTNLGRPQGEYCIFCNENVIKSIGTDKSMTSLGIEYKIFSSKILNTYIDRHRYVAGFNSVTFDDKVCNANGIQIETTYDLYKEIVIFNGKNIKGYKLEDLAIRNFGEAKEVSGEATPVLWQKGEYLQVMNHCIEDVYMLRRLMELDQIMDPKKDNSPLLIERNLDATKNRSDSFKAVSKSIISDIKNSKKKR